jgi:hypothetical protein
MLRQSGGYQKKGIYAKKGGASRIFAKRLAQHFMHLFRAMKSEKPDCDAPRHSSYAV